MCTSVGSVGCDMGIWQGMYNTGLWYVWGSILCTFSYLQYFVCVTLVRLLKAESAQQKALQVTSNPSSVLHIYCFAGDDKPQMSHIWKTITVRFGFV